MGFFDFLETDLTKKQKQKERRELFQLEKTKRDMRMQKIEDRAYRKKVKSIEKARATREGIRKAERQLTPIGKKLRVGTEKTIEGVSPFLSRAQKLVELRTPKIARAAKRGLFDRSAFQQRR